MSTEVSARKIFSLAGPALGVLAASPLYLLLDTAVVGRLGGFELAALGAGTTIHSMVTSQLTFLIYGTTARASRLYGQGKRDAAVAEGVQSTWVGITVGLGLMAIMMLGAPSFAQWLTGDPIVAAETAKWLRVAAIAIPLTLTIMAGNGWLRGVQDTRSPLLYTLAGVIPMAILVPLLVQHMGLVGSAVANVLGMGIVSCCFLIRLFKEHRGSWRPRKDVIINQLQMGRDLIVRSLSFQVAFLSAAAVAARFGTSSLAAHQVLLQLWNFLSMVLDSLAIAAQTLTGAALGGGSILVARAVGLKVTRYSTIFAAGLAVILALGSPFIPHIFTTDAGVLETIAGPWWLLVGLVVLGGVVFALDGVLLGAGDAAYLRNSTIAAVVCGFLPGVWIAYVLKAGLTGVWCGLVAFLFARLVFVSWRFHSMRWAKISDAD
ncbi:MATE family efflux transporter [Corynebacterium caspium]|uniref:MATE family efflux transporter n=1 Tax=Corynebacterium caspium TaxID=234828 RepID=UPI00035E6C2B|nr:MATE family efflux transporter [Corynebacterium caspium]WKD59092.1 DNA-damage-inducible protein F [Corynebacterium caspium DSM 44850]